jgi:hypothetical protein
MLEEILSQITGCQTGMTSYSRQHPRANFVRVMKGKHEIGMVKMLKNLVRARLAF